MKSLTTETHSFTFAKKYFIIQGNNGNHTGYNRTWSINAEGYNTKKEASKIAREMTNENEDIKYGLTPLRIVTAEEIIEILESKEQLSVSNCFDISKIEIENEG